MKRRLLLRAGGAATLGVAAPQVWAQARIAGDVRFFCGFPPGGTADLLCRILADALKAEIGQNVIVESKTGASGFIANETVANAPADGRTVGLAAMAAMCVAPVMPGQKLPINVDTDLTPIASIAGVYNMLVFSKHVPYRTVPELIEQAKKNPGKISYASAGNGTSQHLAGELFKKMAGVNLLHVPYRGGAPAIQDIVAGNCDIMFGNMPEFLGQIGGKNLIPIAFGSPRQSPMFPDLPLISQYLPGYTVVNWFAVFGSRGLPADLVETWNKALRAAVAKPDVQKRFLDNGMDTVIGSPAELRATIAADRKKWAEVIQAAAMRADWPMPLATTKHGSLHYEVVDHVMPWARRGEAILFHHGIGASADIWAGWFPALIDTHPLVSFDMRGYGRSHVPAADFPWSLDLLVADLFAVADAAGLRRFHLVGESIGGTVALAAALSGPERIASLTVSNGAHLGASIQRVEAWRHLLDEGGAKAWSDAFMRDRFHENALSPERWAWFAAQQEKWPRDSILNALGVLIGTDLSSRLRDVTCPTLLLHPDGSPFIPVPVMAELHRLLPDAELNVIGRSRHGLPYSHATLCASLLRAFLETRS